MPAIKLLCHLVEISPRSLSKEESVMLEANFFSYTCQELKETYKNTHKEYFQIIKLNTEMENAIMETNFIRYIINDILSTEEYSLPGLAYYTHTPEDVIFEIATGKNTDPSASLLRKIIELHRTVRPDLYREIMNKIINEHSIMN
jgi:hypothetical protein